MGSGVGVKKKQALRLAGVSTAAEIDYYRVMRVKGIGPSLASGLVNWHSNIERGAANTMPTALPHAEETAIRAALRRPDPGNERTQESRGAGAESAGAGHQGEVRVLARRHSEGASAASASRLARSDLTN